MPTSYNWRDQGVKEAKQANMPNWLNQFEDSAEVIQSLPMRGLGWLGSKLPETVKSTAKHWGNKAVEKVGPENVSRLMQELSTAGDMMDMVNPVVGAPLNIPRSTLKMMNDTTIGRIKHDPNILPAHKDELLKAVQGQRTTAYLGGPNGLAVIDDAAPPSYIHDYLPQHKKIIADTQKEGAYGAFVNGAISPNAKKVLKDYYMTGGNVTRSAGDKRVKMIVNPRRIDEAAGVLKSLGVENIPSIAKVYKHEIKHAAQDLKGMEEAMSSNRSKYGFGQNQSNMTYGEYLAQPNEIGARIQERGITPKAAKKYLEDTGMPSSGNRLMDRYMVEIATNDKIDIPTALKSLEFLKNYLAAHRTRSSYMKLNNPKELPSITGFMQ